MKTLDKLLSVYTTVFTAILIIASLLNGFSSTNLLTLALFLPVIGFVGFELVKYLYRIRYAPPPSPIPLEVSVENSPNPGFFAQSSPLFLLTLALFSLIFAGTLSRAAFYYLDHQQPLSPVPVSQQKIAITTYE